MAKSLRSKTKRFNRTLKRAQVFLPTELARLERLAAKQAEIQDSSVSAAAAAPDQENTMAMDSKEESNMMIEDNDNNDKKVSVEEEIQFKSRVERDQLFLSRNQFKKKMKAKSKAKKSNKRR
jgi:hypothetical protein